MYARWVWIIHFFLLKLLMHLDNKSERWITERKDGWSDLWHNLLPVLVVSPRNAKTVLLGLHRGKAQLCLG